MNIQQERQLLQELLDSGKLDSLGVQVIALNRFAESIGYKAVNGDVRKGFYIRQLPKYFGEFKSKTKFMSLVEIQQWYNISGGPTLEKELSYKMVERISLQYNKKLGKLTTQKHWLKFVKE